MGIGQGVVALLWREWGAFEANVLANVDVILKKYDNYMKEKKLGNSFFIWKVLNAEIFLQNFSHA